MRIGTIDEIHFLLFLKLIGFNTTQSCNWLKFSKNQHLVKFQILRKLLSIFPFLQYFKIKNIVIPICSFKNNGNFKLNRLLFIILIFFNPKC